MSAANASQYHDDNDEDDDDDDDDDDDGDDRDDEDDEHGSSVEHFMNSKFGTGQYPPAHL